MEKKIFYRYMCTECAEPVHSETPVIECPVCGEETDIYYQGMYVNGKWKAWDNRSDLGILRLLHSIESVHSGKKNERPAMKVS